jgi:hypothetical protein
MSEIDGGDCFTKAIEVARRLEAELDTDAYDIMVVHGVVVHPVTGRHWHAWVEATHEVPAGNGQTWPCTTAYDESNGNDVALPADLYRRIGSVEDDKAWRYPLVRAVELMLERGHYGPWLEGHEEICDR